jgi:signal transduction histidine kinase/DNA-binding response OmpR family regulator
MHSMLTKPGLSPPSPFRPLAGALACGVTGLLLDLVHVPLFGGEPGLLLGSAPVFLAAMAWGPWAGGAAAALATAGSGFEGRAGLWALAVAQAAAVGYLPRRRIPAMVAMFLFWLAIEAPALVLAGADTPARGALTAASRLAGGVLGVALAELALSQETVRQVLGPRPPFAGRRPLRSILVHTFVVLGPLPSLLVANFALRGQDLSGAEGRRLETLVLWVPLMGLAIFALSRIAASVTRPLSALSRAQAELAARAEVPLLAEPSPSGPAEIDRLVTGFRQVAAALAGSYASLAHTAAERERLNAELQGLLDGLERKVQERTAELAAATALAEAHSQAKGMFLAHMSHEIRTPLNGVIGIAELLLGSALAADQRERLEALRANAAALLGVVNDILDFSKIEAGRLELDERPVAVGELVEDILLQFAPRAAERGLELVAEIAPELPPRLRLDGSRLRQSLVNLVGNAVRFTHEGAVEILVAAPPRQLRVEVRDSGVGIAEALQDHLFEPFDRPGAVRNGDTGSTGLGLAITKGLVEAMGGTITCASRRGQGTSFTLSIPAEPEPGAPLAAPAVAGKVVLVAAHHPAMARALGAMLARWGAEVRPAAWATEAIELIRAGPLDAALLDLDLVDAEAVGHVWRQRGAELPLLTLAPLGRPLPAPWEEWRARRLSKPVRRAAFAEVLAQVFPPPREVRERAVLLAPNAVASKILSARLERTGFEVVATAESGAAQREIAARSTALVVVDVDGAEADTAGLALVLRTAAAGTAVRLVWVGGDEGQEPPPGFDLRVSRPPRLETLAHLRHDRQGAA